MNALMGSGSDFGILFYGHRALLSKIRKEEQTSRLQK
jgi:hypothetical protein